MTPARAADFRASNRTRRTDLDKYEGDKLRNRDLMRARARYRQNKLADKAGS